MNPLLIMALLSAASAAANYQGQKKVDNSRAAAMNEEARRRKAAEAQAAESAQSTTQLLTNAGRSQDAKAADLEAQYAAHTPPPGAGTSPGLLSSFTAPPRSTLTVASDQRAMDRARAETGAVAKARAGLGAYGDAMVDAGIGANRNQSDIEAQNTNVRNWSQYVLPAQMTRAGEAGKSWGTLADALQLASAIYGPIGLSNVPGTAKHLKTAYDVSTTSGAGGPGIAGLFNA